MRKVPVLRNLSSLVVLLMVVLLLIPAVAEAKAGDEDEAGHPPALMDAKAGDEDEVIGTTGQVEAKRGDEDELAGNTGNTPNSYQDRGMSSEVESRLGIGIALMVAALVVVMTAIGFAGVGVVAVDYWRAGKKILR
ncbi:MAG: hypothetical protein WAM60_02645 [Candidatus Promineifilaceae bacterium]